MYHLKYLLFGIVLYSSFGSAFADEYDPRQDIFDQIINTLVPTLIVFLFDSIESEKNEESEPGSKEVSRGSGENANPRNSNISDMNGMKSRNPEKSRKKAPRIFDKIRRVFDDFLFLLSLFVLPSIVFHKNHKKFATPLWISILLGVTAGFVFIIFIINYILSSNKTKNKSIIYRVISLSGIAIGFCHIISDICFIFYTRSVPKSKFTEVFIFLHSVIGVLVIIYLPIYLASFEFKIIERPEKLFRIILINLTCIWTPVIQMLNMSLLSGNDYYWTKLILAINLIYLSRVINYAKKGEEKNDDLFGALHLMFNIVLKMEKYI
ncbi:hypothetical protein GLOIN_2v1815713 [Rhizophagus clarus]|uniref:Intimal thickness related receptor IRP domain-containing protein n=1 Tax=Rhizophagus clarus TaxID=94130 RepID=A0A8H3LYZ3_9GLOM|nr:hypothetical protein GLOIN_2v1815713 [Rhizophagus clarus]